MIKEKLRAWAPFLIFGVFALILAWGLHDGGHARVWPQAIGRERPTPPTDLVLLNGGGARFSTQVWRGRPYILHFFASWCGDCRKEHEELMTLAIARLPIVGVAFKDVPDRIVAFLNHEGNPYAAIALDDNGEAGKDWGIHGVPETFLVDAAGRIQWHHRGILTESVVSESLLPLVEALDEDF